MISPPGRMLLDTSVIIDLPRVDLDGFTAWRAAASAVTVAELAYGADVPDPVERRVRNERYYAVVHHYDVLPFDLSAAKFYGVLASLVRQSGRNPRPRRMDLQIAATAAVHELPLLTRNVSDFEGLERAVEVVGV